VNGYEVTDDPDEVTCAHCRAAIRRRGRRPAPTLTVSIHTDGSAFTGEGEPGAELARLLRRIAADVETNRVSIDPRGVLDANGNTCGRWSLR